MSPHKCLVCYEHLEDNDLGEYHKRCIKKLFSTNIPPTLEVNLDDISELAKQEINARVTVPGVQPKLSLNLKKGTQENRLTIVGLWGNYVLKPPFQDYPNLPENEDLCMNLAEICNIPVASHCLLRLQSGELAYLCKRFDREENSKLACEDMCQLTGVLTENKYHSSMEKIAKAIVKFSSNPGFDLIRFLEVLLFSYLIGNADSHLKNFSLLTNSDGDISFSPAYDLVSTKIALPADKEELALPLNGKKRNIRQKDFIKFAVGQGIPEKAVENTFKRFGKVVEQFIPTIKISFLHIEMQEQLISLIEERKSILNL